MKYLFKPGKKSTICFICASILCVLCNLSFFLVHINLIPANVDFLLLLHTILPICYFFIALFAVLYVDLCLEHLISFAPQQYTRALLMLLGFAEVVSIVIILLSIYNQDLTTLFTSAYEPLQDSIYFEAINYLLPETDRYIVYSFWSGFSVFFSATLLICLIVRLVKRIRLAKRAKQEKQAMDDQAHILTQENGIDPGFDYATCEFYNQTQIPFYELNQEDGSLGEFLAYYALSKSEFEDLSFLFNRQVPKSDGLCTEIDLLIIHKNGIIVLENKHYTTRIFGNANAHDLTIIDHAGHKRSIYNPIRQNEKHVLALQEFLKSKGLYINQDVTPIHSVVVFTADQYDNSDDIISGINTSRSTSFVCTSQNLPIVINRLLEKSAENVELNVTEIVKLLTDLPIFEKTNKCYLN